MSNSSGLSFNFRRLTGVRLQPFARTLLILTACGFILGQNLESAWAAVSETTTKIAPNEAPAPAARVVTRVVGQVDTHFLTSREVRMSDAIDQALDASPVEFTDALKSHSSPETHAKSKVAKISTRPFPGKLLSGEEKTFPNNVSKVLDEWMISLEASSLQATPPLAAEIATNVHRVNEFWGERAAWRALEVSPEELRKMMERKLSARSFEDFKSNVATAPVSDAEAFSYYERNRLRFGNMPFSTFKENIKSFLTKQQMEMRLNEWLEVLRRKYKVRNFIAG